MNKIKLGLLLFCAFLTGPALGQESRTVGLLKNSSTALDGFTLFSPGSSTNTYLVNTCGELINTWTSAYRPGNAVYLQPDGTLWRAGRLENRHINAGGAGGIIERMDWDSNVIWSYTYNTSEVRAHHDFQVLPNGNVLILAWEVKKKKACLTNGRNPDLLPDSELWPEKIIEVEPVGTNQGVIVWEWNAWDHMIQDYDPAKENYGDVAAHPEKIDINYIRPGVDGADWQHANSIHYNAQLDQIILSVLFFDEVWIIDHNTTTQQAAGPKGDLLFRWGNDQAFRGGLASDQKLFGQHNAQWIGEGLLDEGQILIFNNGQERPEGAYTSVVKIATSLVDGKYQKRSNGAFLPENFSWEYVADPPESFYSRFISGAQQLPNDNVFITDGAHGRFFEIDPQERIVWEYVNPVTVFGVAEQGASVLNPNGEGTNTVFRATKYPISYQGFTGKNLEAEGILEIDPDNVNPCLVLSSELPAKVEVYPNPTTEIIRINNYHGNYQLTSLRGTVLYTGTVKSNHHLLDMSALEPGLYLVKLEMGPPIKIIKTR